MPKTKQAKQEEAAERMAQRQARTTREQLKLISQRPGKSLDETARLLLRLEQERLAR